VPRRGVDLAVVAHAAVEPLRATLPDSVRVRYELGAAPPIRAAADQLHVALEHLVRNAAEALLSGGGTIVVGLRHLDGRVVLSVADDGPGIPDSLLPHVFAPFSSSKSITAGLGLGLPIVRDIVTRHRGRVSLASSPAGTTVTLSFEPSGAAERQAGRRRVLLVDDHDDVRATFQAMLADAGWDVTAVASAEEALRALDEQEVDALLIDVQMSGRDGLALLEALALWHPSLVPRVALHTGYADEPRVREAAGRHGVTVLEKPCRRAELLAALERAAAASPATRA
jgi:CheY-like chemotaxis protein/anti-sigma regulatory factor (Ser/Thr protein kinase)